MHFSKVQISLMISGEGLRIQQCLELLPNFDVPIILMHNRNNKQYKHLIRDIIADLHESIALFKAAGVTQTKFGLIRVLALRKLRKIAWRSWLI